MKIPVVKEWGSWAVFVSSAAAAVAAALRTAPPGTGEGSAAVTSVTVLGLALLINAKNPLASLMRGRGKESLVWSVLHCFAGLLLLSPFLIRGITAFAPFSLLILSYGMMLYHGKEHSLTAELNGFALLTITAPVIFFTIAGDLSLRLYAAVFLFFAAGIFKVRVRTRKTLQYRWAMAGYCVLAAAAYAMMDIPLIVLLPIAENIFSAVAMREEKLRVTGYTELIKGMVFVVLIALFWE